MNLKWKDLASFHLAGYVIQAFLENGPFFFPFNREAKQYQLDENGILVKI